MQNNTVVVVVVVVVVQRLLLLLLLLCCGQRVKSELQQERWSPIPSLRRRRRPAPAPNCNSPASPECSEPQQHDTPTVYSTCLDDDDNDDDDDDAVERRLGRGDLYGYLPFRMHAAVPQLTRPVDSRGSGGGGPRLPCSRRRPGPPRRHAPVDTFYRRQQMLRKLKKRTAELTKALPTFHEVNRIDRMSRLGFPSLFILFNVAYWSYYSIR